MFNLKFMHISSLVLDLCSISLSIITLFYLLRYLLIEYRVKKTLNIKYSKFILRLFPNMWRRLCAIILFGSSIPLTLFVAQIEIKNTSHITLPDWLILLIILSASILSIATMLVGLGILIKTKKDLIKVEFLNVEKPQVNYSNVDFKEYVDKVTNGSTQISHAVSILVSELLNKPFINKKYKLNKKEFINNFISYWKPCDETN